jgi:hypothetical protein
VRDVPPEFFAEATAAVQADEDDEEAGGRINAAKRKRSVEDD